MKCIIKQIKDVGNCDYAFRDYDEDKFNENDYETVCSFSIPAEEIERVDGEPTILLDDVYTVFNWGEYKGMKRPDDYKGRSLSVSDVVELDGRKFYCQSIGWREI